MPASGLVERFAVEQAADGIRVSVPDSRRTETG
jgi:hypothetical protein